MGTTRSLPISFAARGLRTSRYYKMSGLLFLTRRTEELCMNKRHQMLTSRQFLIAIVLLSFKQKRSFDQKWFGRRRIVNVTDDRNPR